MKLELKNIKHTEWASQETLCYQAALYVAGKPVAIVSNDGHGGCDREYPHPKHKGDFRAAMAAVHAHFAALPVDDTYGMAQQLEYWCADTVNNWLTARELKQMMRTQILFQKEGEEEAGVFGTKYYPKETDGTFWNGRRVLNDMPFDEALAIWKETA